MKPAAVNRELACFRALFRKAVEWERMAVSPMKVVKSFKEVPNPPRMLEHDEVAKILQELPDRVRALLACAAYAGLRAREIYYLRWTDIRWDEGVLEVVSQEEWTTKNNRTRRVPMSSRLAGHLRRNPRRLGSPYVFTNRFGNLFDRMDKFLRGAAKRAGVPGRVTLHQFRHSFCSHCFMKGTDPHTIQQWMGHRQITTTMRYAHVSAAHEESAIERLDFEETEAMESESRAV
ncbi:tyrosine-type recombinase/integrase [Candidatus Latescibacterota bacterium]